MNTVEDVLGRLQKVTRSGKGWSACCPAHEDSNPSLSVAVGEDGKILLHCFAGCDYQSICATLGVEKDQAQAGPSATTAKRPPTTYPSPDAAAAAALASVQRLGGARWRIVERYPYADVHGEVLAEVVRLEDPKAGQKTFRPISKWPDGWRVGDPRGQWPLYRLPALNSALTVFVVEGEKAADAAVGLGLYAITSAHGAKAPRKMDWSPLAGRDVVLLPDNDEPGRGYVREVAEILQRLSPPAKVRILVLPGLPEHGDIVEFIEARKSEGASPAETRDEVLRLAAQAPSVSSVGPGLGVSVHTWPAPKPLPAALPPVPPFEPAILPPATRPWIEDIADRFQCPVEYLAASQLVILSSLIGKKVSIRPKRYDVWTVVPNLWGVLVGRPSSMKTPSVREMMAPIRRLEAQADQEFQSREAEFEAQKLLADRRKRSFTLLKGGKNRDPQLEMEEARQLVRDEPDPPALRRYVVNDTTVEKLGEILRDNPNGTLVYRDELMGFLRGLDKPGQDGSRAFYLEAWDGLGPYTFDRVTRGTLHIPNAIVSILGNIQPGPIQKYMAEAVRLGLGDDGLAQRFQVAVWPDVPKTWKNVDRLPDAEARQRGFDAYERLASLTAEEAGAESSEHGPPIPFLRFHGDAQAVFDEWRCGLEHRLLEGDEHPAFESHLVKYRSLVPSIALIDHLANGGVGPVPVSALERAVAWIVFLEAHARRLYAGVIQPDLDAAQRILGRIQSGKLQDAFVSRDVYRSGWTGLTDRETVEAGLGALVDYDWLRVEVDHSTGGAPATRYRINPAAGSDAGESAEASSRAESVGVI